MAFGFGFTLAVGFGLWLHLASGFWPSVAPYLLDKSRKNIIGLLVSASLGSWLWLHLAFGFWRLACKQTFVGLAWNRLWLHLALGFWLWLHFWLQLALGFWPFWFSGLLAFGFTWLYDTLKKSVFREFTGFDVKASVWDAL